MKRQNKFILIATIIALGLFFELLKNSGKATRQNGSEVVISAQDLNDLDLKPYHSDTQANKDAVKRRLEQLKSRNQSEKLKKLVESYSFEEGKKKNLKKKDEKKKDKKKKLAKKKKKDEKKPLADARIKYLDSKSDKAADAKAGQDASGFDDGGYAAAAAPAVEKKQRQLSEDEWTQLILSKPDFKTTLEMIRAFQQGDLPLTSFYKIVALMTDDSRTEMRELGLKALASTPSYQSFVALSNLSENSSDQNIKTKALATMIDYTELGNLSALSSVLRYSDSLYTVQLAALRLKEAAERHLKVVPTESNDPTAQNQDRTPTSADKNAKFFEPFKSVLQLVITQSNDNYTTQVMTDTLQRIEGLLAG